MAEVYDAFDDRLARPVAVKLLRPQLAVQPEVRRRFEAEARVAASISHPNVVAVYDTGEFEGRAYIVMERVKGDFGRPGGRPSGRSSASRHQTGQYPHHR
jgi:serine/threonine protein kinase